jgi:hypothetical protein
MKGIPMRKLRRITTIFTAILLALSAALAAAPAAFAMRLPPPDGDPGPAATPTYIVTHAGMAGWQIALIAIGAALASVALTIMVIHVRFRARLHPAAG